MALHILFQGLAQDDTRLVFQGKTNADTDAIFRCRVYILRAVRNAAGGVIGKGAASKLLGSSFVVAFLVIRFIVIFSTSVVFCFAAQIALELMTWHSIL